MIRITHLSKRFGDVVAVDDLTLEVPKGELFCFLGPNGAGKTTTIKVLTGLLHPTAGEAFVGGIDVQRDPVEARRITGYIPDMPFLYERLTPTEFYEFTGDLYGVPRAETRERMSEAFALFGLSDQKAALVRDLSHGMRQRLIYASTFLHSPRVLFIDEPLIGLDPYTIRLIKDLLRRKAKEGMTIFLTTHILALAEDIADRIGIIMNGRLLTVGDVPALLEQHGGRDLEEAFLALTAAGEEQSWASDG